MGLRWNKEWHALTRVACIREWQPINCERQHQRGCVKATLVVHAYLLVGCVSTLWSPSAPLCYQLGQRNKELHVWHQGQLTACCRHHRVGEFGVPSTAGIVQGCGCASPGHLDEAEWCRGKRYRVHVWSVSGHTIFVAVAKDRVANREGRHVHWRQVPDGHISWSELGSVVAAWYAYGDILQEVASGGDSSCNSRSVGE